MSKADALLKKAIAYEILSLYGNRTDYLKAVAQQLDYVTGPGQKITFDPNSIPAPNYQMEDTNIPPPPPAPETIEMPEETISAAPPAKKNTTAPAPETTRTLQIFLNKAFANDIAQGKMTPIAQDDIYGPETEGRLKQWAARNKVPAASGVASMFNTALQQSAKA